MSSNAEEAEYWAPRLAKSILRNTLRLKSGESVTIEAWTDALPWVDAFVVEARLLGAHPMVVYESDRAFWTSFEKLKTKDDLGKLGAQEIAALRETDAYVFFYGPSDRIRYHSLSEKILDSLSKYEDEWFKIVEEKKIRFCRIELTKATEALAKEYGINYAEWRKELLESSVIDTRKMQSDGAKIADAFAKGRNVLITHPNGTNLELRLLGRKPFVDDGVVDENDTESGYGQTNAPAGVVMTALDESFADGVFKSNKLVRYGPGKGETTGGTWTFKGGRLVKYAFESGKSSFEKGFKSAGSEKYKPATLSVGLNPKVHNSPLYDDQELGTIAVYVGGNKWLGGSNTGEYHTWLLLRGANLSVDGVSIVRSGKIV